MNTYLLFKSLHLISVISWMAGLLYLPRIYVYHVENSQNKDVINIVEEVLIDFNNDIVDSLNKKGSKAVSINTKKTSNNK